MTDFLFHKKDEAEPTPVAPKAPEATVTPEPMEAPVTPETPEVSEVPEVPETTEAPETVEEPKEEISATYLLEQLEAIRKDTDYLHQALHKIFELGQDAETQIDAIQKIVTRREATNQQLIQFYSDLLFRMNPPKSPKMPDIHFDWGKKWSDYGNRVRKSVGHTLTELRKEPASTLDQVTAILRDPALSAEEKKLVLDHANEIRDLEESVQAQVMEILGDPALSVEEKELILDHLEDLQELS